MSENEEFYAPVPHSDEGYGESNLAELPAHVGHAVIDWKSGQDLTLGQESAPPTTGKFDLESAFTSWAIEAELSQHQINLLRSRYEAALQKTGEGLVELAPGLYATPGQFAVTKAEATRELRSQLGKNYDSALTQARSACRRFGGVGLVRLLDQTGLGNAPVMVKAWVAVANAVGGGSGYNSGLTSETGLQAELDQIARDPALVDKHHVDHDKVVKRWGEVISLLNPEETDY